MAAAMLSRSLLPACVVALALASGLLGAGCKKETPLDLYVAGFLPEHVRFEVEDLGEVDDARFEELRKRPDIDGAAPLPPGTCGGPCRAAIFSVYVTNKAREAEAAPVVRLDVPLGKPARLPIAYRGGEVSPGRIGRIRWLVSLYPEEKGLTATLSSSVFIVNDPTTPAAQPATAPPQPAKPPAPAPAPASGGEKTAPAPQEVKTP